MSRSQAGRLLACTCTTLTTTADPPHFICTDQQATDADSMGNEAVTGCCNDSMEHNGVRYGWQDEPWFDQ